jgi:hypothetical protein
MHILGCIQILSLLFLGTNMVSLLISGCVTHFYSSFLWLLSHAIFLSSNNLECTQILAGLLRQATGQVANLPYRCLIAIYHNPCKLIYQATRAILNQAANSMRRGIYLQPLILKK